METQTGQGALTVYLPGTAETLRELKGTVKTHFYNLSGNTSTTSLL